MNIAFLMGALNRGGAETLIHESLVKLREYNNDNSIIIHRRNGNMSSLFKEAAGKIFLINITHPWHVVKYILRLRSIIKREQIDIIHAQQPIDAFYAYLSQIGKKNKLILTLHGHYNFSNNYFALVLFKFIIKRTNYNIYVSQSQKQYYCERYRLKENKQKVIYNGISFKKFTDNSNTNLRAELNIPPGSILLAMVGSFAKGRDHLTVCRFLNLLNQNKIDFHFLFIGSASDKTLFNECHSYCRNQQLLSNVHFLGMRNDVPSILKQLDAFIYSTNHDTFGLAVTEAIAAGIPVFTNDWIAMCEVTQNGKLANLYKSRDEHDLLLKFSNFLDNKQQYCHKAQLNADKIKNLYGIEKHVSNLKRTYNSLINNTSN